MDVNFDDLPEDLQDVEIIYSDGEDDDNDQNLENDEFFDESDQQEIEYEVNDISKLTFSKHTKSVFACDVSKDLELVITGGEDDMAYVWGAKTGDIVLECTGHKDSVTQVAFSHDDALICSADMAGMVQVWSKEQNGTLIWCNESDDIEWLQWHPLANVLLYGCKEGDIYVWQVPQGNCKVLPGHGASSTCGTVLPDGKKLVSGYSDGKIKLWNIKDATVIWQVNTGDPDDPKAITTLDVNSNGTLLAVAPTANIILLGDGKIATKLLIDGDTEIESCLISSELGVLVTGSLSGQLCVWDLGKYAIRHQARVECAVTVMQWGPNGTVLVGGTDGAVYMCDVRTGTLVTTLTGHRADILGLKYKNGADFLVTTSDDFTAKIFEVKL